MLSKIDIDLNYVEFIVKFLGLAGFFMVERVERVGLLEPAGDMGAEVAIIDCESRTWDSLS